MPIRHPDERRDVQVTVTVEVAHRNVGNVAESGIDTYRDIGGRKARDVPFREVDPQPTAHHAFYVTDLLHDVGA
ncbi:MAG: hypothetical protein K2V38_23315, partial [Gemmataceae bacterium]|nr:hypothetical protein [Gemmataceae bacterium]